MRQQRVFHRRIDERANSAGFTLVELCVIIALMSLLTALLLPALSSAKEKTRRTVCKSNLRQLDLVLQYYADEHGDVLPSAADNIGNYHSVRLSDQTFTNLVDYADGNSNIFYCPNLVFNAGPKGLPTHDSFGTIIGYSYLASGVVNPGKGADNQEKQIKLSTLPGTNELIADANYWTASSSTGHSPVKAMAPHTPAGGAIQTVPSSTVTTSSSLGGVGGNVLRADHTVGWRTITSMDAHPASSENDAVGNW